MNENDMSRHIEIFPWNSAFEVGVKQIDDQHKVLVGLINEICTNSLKNEDPTKALELSFSKIIDYTKFHFDYEEKLYEENCALKDTLNLHKEHHQKLVSEILSQKAQYDKEENKVTGLDAILSMLVLWLTNHILRDDMRMWIMIDLLKDGVNAREVEELADRKLEAEKGSISNVMISMINVSSASFRELRREIKLRVELEEELKKEIDSRKKTEERLKYLSQRDALTDLPNRRLYEELCDAALRVAQRNKTEQAVLFVDVDGFKAVNDTLGHNAGDELLKSIAKGLGKCVRGSDVVARIGGDEFVIHLGGDCKPKVAQDIASKIVVAMSVPFELTEGTANVSVSIGIASYPLDAITAAELLKNADAAMYRAKETGKNAYKLFSEL